MDFPGSVCLKNRTTNRANMEINLLEIKLESLKGEHKNKENMVDFSSKSMKTHPLE